MWAVVRGRRGAAHQRISSDPATPDQLSVGSLPRSSVSGFRSCIRGTSGIRDYMQFDPSAGIFYFRYPTHGLTVTRGSRQSEFRSE